MDKNQLEQFPTIHDVILQPLKQIVDERGRVLHMLRNDSPLFKNFGEIYFSEVLSGVIKGWKKHTLMTQNFVVPVGKIKLVIYDDRPNSISCGKAMDITMGRPDNYHLVQIPPLLWYGFQGLASTPSLLANCADLPHDSMEAEQIAVGTKNMPQLWEEL
jgi:dTDP-4-dehydrorhamnose 3,5-epimerase